MRSFAFILGTAFAVSAQTISLSGVVSNQSGKPLSGAIVTLKSQKLIDTTSVTGAYAFGGPVGVLPSPVARNSENIALKNGVLSLKLIESAPVRIEILDIGGHALAKLFNGRVAAGEYRFDILTKRLSTQVLVISVAIHRSVSTFRYLPTPGNTHMIASPAVSMDGKGRVLVTVPAAVDTLVVSKSGYATKATPVTSYQGTLNVTLDTVTLARFSFFVTSLKALQELSGSQNGFGGDFRFGKTGPGAGLKGADSICSCIAERSMPGSSVKQWRAFLSVTADENGKQVNAIDRVGNGPWYDRRGRVLALTRADLLNTRPANADPAIVNDLPNEDGVPNHQPDPTQPQVDNHHFVTGSKTDGTLYSTTTTCADWTSTTASGRPQCGLSWPRNMGGGGESSSHWISSISAGGCVAGIQITNTGGGGGSNTIGSGGGYGGFYCFALTP